ncbi:MAG: WbqC family protein [Deltaproteobacteria bacterium]|nr:WbqC family protein [Deltaproteobacteria bacterium]
MSDPRTVAVLQPGYLPWLGFFEQLYRADVFVFYDDVQFDKHGWRNRNRIKAPTGPHWLTVPVRHAGLDKPKLSEILVDNSRPWAKKHLGTIRQFYRDAPFLDRYLPTLEELLARRWERLVELDLAAIALLSGWLGLRRDTVRSSELGVDGGQTERLVSICDALGATRYLSGAAARDYLDVAQFDARGIAVEWQEYRHPVYRQLHGDFVPHLSALDLVLNYGDESLGILTSDAQRGVG